MLVMLALTVVHSAEAAECRLALEKRFDAPFQVFGATASAVGDDVVLIGGSTPTGVTGAVWRLRGLSTWEPMDVTVTNRRHHGAAVWRGAEGDVIAVIDGHGFDDGARVARPGAELVTLGATPRVAPYVTSPVARYLIGAAAVDGRLIAAGGHSEGRLFHDRVDVWDVATQAWTPGPPLAEARDTQLVVADGRLYALGGFSGEGCEPSSQVERLSADRTRWEARKPMYEAISAFSAAALGGGIFTFGDYDRHGLVTRYDVASDTWAAVTPDFTPRRHSAAATVGDRIVVVGGTTALEGSWFATTEVFAWTCD